MKYRIIYIACLLFTITFSSEAQKEAYNWCFGDSIGLTWNTTQTMSLTDVSGSVTKELKGLPTHMEIAPVITTREGCFSLSDENGQLSLYSDGSSIWNRNHKVMPNGSGLKGHLSSPQSGIAFPYPGHPNQYVCVTVGIEVYNNLAYSIVDMTRRGGLGEVISTQKNLLFPNYEGLAGEALSAVGNATGDGYWIVALTRGIDGSNDRLYAWLLTKDGLSDTPVVSILPGKDTLLKETGYLKFSPNGKYFVLCGGDKNKLLYAGKFNTSTGLCSDVKELVSALGLSNSINGFYGVEFSKNSELVYIAHPGSWKSNFHILCFNIKDMLASSKPQTVPYKKFNTLKFSPASVQMGPDGRIYISGIDMNQGKYEKHRLFVLDNPNDYENFNIFELPTDFIPTYKTPTNIGLPSFIPNWFLFLTGPSHFCVNTSQTFTLNVTDNENILSYTKWDFGDGSTVETGSNSLPQSKPHVYSSPGTYTITVKLFDSNDVEIDTQTLEVSVSPCSMPVNPNIHLY
ncbi:hypothetical protein M2463_003655 [Parabacteroides sp. PH5-13]|uniref:PKD domain-containing protein n=1 Tax=unclassified Parabacteroides TaxID=2649774 RepID=UPI002476A32D|nr:MULTISPECIES: PKD domain-containing protein [unclassified Parabacteroides]MDH6306867.1 hypothetical protein [Parabacteroides sp. PH5-39]MDH6321617.1 hypothetical protein [Parabacteroides sp. PH5-13]MDH6325254.1 hypothetical protein [Parabacteroides sp. PH5-8]MDH6386367.1 hypothetical protein [Parabacteroides sp. PH5-17]MDH6395723.1 hypothetical protein [Parabacteroides sp. PFB2-22]